MTIELITSADAALLDPIRQLLGQLTQRQIEFGLRELQALVENKASQLFVLSIDGSVAGMLTLGTYLSPTGCKAWIEDVVVDKQYRGCGYGRCLVEHAMEYCRQNLAPCLLMLTSNPSRIAANALYRSSGFEQKITNIYKYDCL